MSPIKKNEAIDTIDIEKANFNDILNDIYSGLYIVDSTRKIIFWNKAAEEITGYKSNEVVGSHCYDNILIHVDGDGNSLCTGMCPLLATIQDEKKRDADVFLHHKQGHRVPVNVRTSILKNDAGKVIGGIELFSDISNKEITTLKIKELEKLAFLDTLTQLANRAFTDMEIDAKFAEKNRYGTSFAIIFFDIDHFKNFNDTYGHETGDRVLETVAKTLQANARPFDLFGRWGGEEFLGILHNVSGQELKQLTERLRMLISKTRIKNKNETLSVTVSVGATLVKSQDDKDIIIGRADKLMYKSKQNGRNQVTIG